MQYKLITVQRDTELVERGKVSERDNGWGCVRVTGSVAVEFSLSHRALQKTTLHRHRLSFVLSKDLVF